MPLPVGTLAPDFRLLRTSSIRIALHSLLGQPVVLVFYPMDWEPVSRDQLALNPNFADEFARLKAHLLGISIDHVYGRAAFSARRSFASRCWLTSSRVAGSPGPT